MLHIEVAGQALQMVVEFVAEVKFHMARHHDDGLPHEESKDAADETGRDDEGAKNQQTDKEIDKIFSKILHFPSVLSYLLLIFRLIFHQKL